MSTRIRWLAAAAAVSLTTLAPAQPAAAVSLGAAVQPAASHTRSAGLSTNLVAAAVDYQERATLAARWQASQLTDGRIYNREFKFDDWGLTIDTGLMLTAAGTTPHRLATLEGQVRQHFYQDYAGGGTAAGALAKTLLFASELGADVRNFGGRNVRADVLDHVQGAGAGLEQGRISDTGKKDYSNVLTQSYGVLALAPTGGAPQPVVDYLLRQRCAAGYFRLSEVVGETCRQSGSDPDIDATAVGLQALQAAAQHGASVPARAIDKSVAWLVLQQRANGSFGGTELGPNTNSTGLVANALAATDRTEARLRAAAYVARMQITEANSGRGPARNDLGATAYNRPALRSALADGIRPAQQDQFRRATPQAYFALRHAPQTETSGYCTTDSGVTVVVDFRSLGGDVDVRCAADPVNTGLDALEQAGFTYSLVTSGLGALVCRIEGQPSAAAEDCQDTPPQSAYWSYWTAANGGDWKFSTSGAGSSDVAAGGFEGWSFSVNDNAQPPAIDPTRPEAADPSALPTAGTTPASPGPSIDTATPAGSAAEPAGSALPTVIGLGLIGLLAAGAGLMAWRRSRRG